MRIVTEIRAVYNGYVYRLDEWSPEYVSNNLMDIAREAGERLVVAQPAYTPDGEYVHYRLDKNAHDLERVCDLVRMGSKIEAIKELRHLYTHTFGLKAAKELVEAMMLLHKE